MSEFNQQQKTVYILQNKTKRENDQFKGYKKREDIESESKMNKKHIFVKSFRN